VEETAREELSPPLPAGINSAPEAKLAVLLEGDMDIGFDWR
jgi:hypothetical protein